MEPDEDPDLVAKYPNVTGPNANLIREIRRERRIELLQKDIDGMMFAVGMWERLYTIVNVEVPRWIRLFIQKMKYN